ncbi:hypothetical protein DSM106972_045560 [Dulcicalothrix desertica PCC 7102]|uniref:Uncharacterized protein n=1 Tax=Dulcicalothrix desertica PCC 7102 TaxID=232991 RepID=A0A433VE13_9CYAN|nr:hypothetical protein DSM106972_045560 [Dulcicalothrix desertica PCC 7102]
MLVKSTNFNINIDKQFNPNPKLYEVFSKRKIQKLLLSIMNDSTFNVFKIGTSKKLVIIINIKVIRIMFNELCTIAYCTVYTIF